MTPSTGVTDAISIALDSDSAARTPMLTPISAVRIGSPAPMSVPSITISTSAAITTPAISPIPMMAGVVCATSAENSTPTPSIGDRSKWSSTACLVVSGSSKLLIVKAILTIAVLPSVETVRMPDERSSSAAPRSSTPACASSCFADASS